MIEAIVESLQRSAQANPWLAVVLVFIGGLLTAANPCVIAMVPLMIAYVAGQESRGVARSFLLSLAFTLGLSATFTLMFLVAVSASSLLGAAWWSYVAAAVCLLMGLHMLGLLTWHLPTPSGIHPKHRGYAGALLLGAMFGLVSLPCVGPILGALLAVIPLTGTAFGATLLLAYSLGHCGLILVGGTSMGLVQRAADSHGWQRGIKVVRKVAGVVIVAAGLWLLFR